MFSNEKLFEIALNLQESWYVKRIEFDTLCQDRIF